MKKFTALFLLLTFLFTIPPARADEGMWTYNNFPAAEVGKKYGFTPVNPVQAGESATKALADLRTKYSKDADARRVVSNMP